MNQEQQSAYERLQSRASRPKHDPHNPYEGLNSDEYTETSSGDKHLPVVQPHSQSVVDGSRQKYAAEEIREISKPDQECSDTSQKSASVAEDYELTEDQVKRMIGLLTNNAEANADNLTKQPSSALYLDLVQEDDPSYETNKYSCPQVTSQSRDYEGLSNDLTDSKQRGELKTSASVDVNRGKEEIISPEGIEEYDSITEYDYINDNPVKTTAEGETHKPPRRPLPIIPLDTTYEHLNKNGRSLQRDIVTRKKRMLMIKIAVGLTVFLCAVIIAVIITLYSGANDQESRSNAESFLNNVRKVGEIIGGGTISGLTVLNSKLFVVRESSQVSVYIHTTTFTDTPDPKITGSSSLYAIIASRQYNCLYISDGINTVYRYNLSGHVIGSWSVGGACRGLSLTSTNNVLATLVNPAQIKEYTPDGSLVREIILDSSVASPRHSIQLSSDQFVVSHGWGESLHRVCKVDTSGRIINKCYGGSRGSGVGQLNEPGDLAVNRHGDVLVADHHNNRVIMMTPSLTHLGYLKIPEHTLRGPSALYLDHLSRRLYIGGLTSNLVNGLVSVFDV